MAQLEADDVFAAAPLAVPHAAPNGSAQGTTTDSAETQGLRALLAAKEDEARRLELALGKEQYRVTHLLRAVRDLDAKLLEAKGSP